MTLVAALLGWMFDGLEMGLFPLVAGPALRDLLGTTERTDVGRWVAIITAGFLIGAATGGVLFGWLGDRIGRVRAMTLSVLTYAVFSGICGLASEAWQVATFRFLASLGMGGEWSLGVALVMEVWPDRSRAWLAAAIGAAANFGYMIIAVAGLALSVILTDIHAGILSIGIGPETADWLVKNSGWRILMLSGALPALLTFLIRLFVPESHRWEAENRKGSTSHWQAVDLIGVLIGAGAGCALIALWAVPEIDTLVRVIGSLAMILVLIVGYLYPIVRYVKRAEAAAGRSDPIEAAGLPADAVPLETRAAASDRVALRAIVGRLLLAASLSGVALLGTWGSTQWAPTWADELSNDEAKAALGTVIGSPGLAADRETNRSNPRAKAYTQIATASGAIFGCVAAALVGGWLGRRVTYAGLCIGSMVSIVGLFQLNQQYGPTFLIWAFAAGTITAAFYGWLPLYLPELFRTKIRATAQGFGFNFGRVLAAIGVLQLPVVMRQLNVGWQGACSAMSVIYLVGLGLIWLAPETKGKPLPE
jgi:MFS family permease